MKATHGGYKSYYIKDVTGAIHKCTTKAFDVLLLQQDLLAGRALLDASYWVILGMIQEYMDFSSNEWRDRSSNWSHWTTIPRFGSLFFVETVPMSETQFKNMSGYAFWHRRLGYFRMQKIRDMIPHPKGIEELSKANFDPNKQYPACMIGKASQEIRPLSREHSQRTLERVYNMSSCHHQLHLLKP